MRVNPASIAFDIDSVIADTMQLFLDIARDHYRIDTIRYEDFTTYDLNECLDLDEAVITDIIDRIQQGRYVSRLKPIKGAPEGLVKVGQVASPVLFVTARPHPGPIDQWFRSTVALAPACFEIVATGSYERKISVLREKGVDCFVEDRLETCYELQAAGITPILFKQPWNRRPHPFMEVEDWNELECLLGIR
ncbi:MAG: haloacid dehalogenase [Deltaproteobacteria bacterium]|nr:haloacid dehalogenase [Deltaproteobacteria bacterium]MBW1960978.1 haloacid dehalogenase [Deltaproteobacteria bacterium]MBW1995649.1 haloacid dehalogenase [Deltaproteobacteria bacterium]MBW2151541.1 haloacid dehalogenase [Deltaproteobacteria bacterium]